MSFFTNVIPLSQILNTRVTMVYNNLNVNTLKLTNNYTIHYPYKDILSHLLMPNYVIIIIPLMT